MGYLEPRMFFGYVRISGADKEEANGIYWAIKELEGVPVFQQNPDAKGLRLQYNWNKKVWSIERTRTTKLTDQTVRYYTQPLEEGSPKIPVGELNWHTHTISKGWLSHMTKSVVNSIRSSKDGTSKLTFEVVLPETAIQKLGNCQVGIRLIEIERWLLEERQGLSLDRRHLDSQRWAVGALVMNKQGQRGRVRSVPVDNQVTVEIVDPKKTQRLQKKLKDDGAKTWRDTLVTSQVNWNIYELTLAPESEARTELMHLYEVLMKAESDLKRCYQRWCRHRSLFSHGEKIPVVELYYGPDVLDCWEIMDDGTKQKLGIGADPMTGQVEHAGARPRLPPRKLVA